MPVRFTTPSLGGQGELQVADPAAHQWRLAVGYRHLHADQLFVGTQLLPTNQPLIINLHSVDVTTSYAVTDRFSLSLTVPFVDGMQSRMYADSARHAVTALGLGDVSLIGRDRKSTRLNSSHLVISYAVFCLKKKNNYDDSL